MRTSNSLSAAVLVVAVAAACSTPAADDRGIVHKTYALKHATVDQVVKTLNEEEQGTPDHRVIIVADVNRNAVVVRGTPEDHSRIEQRIRVLDVR